MLYDVEYTDESESEPYTHRPWPELTKHWNPERKAANARAEAKIRAEIRRLQARARKEVEAPAMLRLLGRRPGARILRSVPSSPVSNPLVTLTGTVAQAASVPCEKSLRATLREERRVSEGQCNVRLGSRWR